MGRQLAVALGAAALAATFMLAGTGLAQGVGAGQRFERLDANRDGRIQRRELPERAQRRLERLGQVRNESRQGVTREQLDRFRAERRQTRERLEAQGQRRAERFQAQGERRAERFRALREMRRSKPELFRELREFRRQTRERSPLHPERAAPPRAPRRSI